MEEEIQQEIKPKKKSIIREYVEAFAIAIVLALFIRTFIIQAFKIPSSSMESTLLIGDHLIVSKFSYGIKVPLIKSKLFLKAPERGEVIVFEYPVDHSKDFIKRAIGLPGDRVEIINKKVYVNGKPLNESYTQFADDAIIPKEFQPRDNFGPITVPEGHIFAMGDNRDRSSDSRFWGFVDLNEIKGRALVIYWSWDTVNTTVRWGRIGKLIK